MFNRKLAVAALSVSVLLGTSACSFTRNVPTLQMYAPSEGVDGNLNAVHLRNFIFLTNGTETALIGSAVNTTEQSVTFNLQFGDNLDRATVDLTLEPGQKLDIGYNGNAPAVLPLTTKAGDVVSIFAAEPGANPIRLNVPVLDGRLSQYTELMNTIFTPTAAPTATPEATPSPSASGN